MNKAFLALGVLICMPFASICTKKTNYPAKDKLEYHLSWDGQSSTLKVSLDYIPANKDSTVFIYGSPEFGGQTDIFKIVQNINCNSSDSLKINSQEHQITIYHSDVEPKRINYEINGQLVNNPKRAIYDELFRPVITEKTMYMVGCFFMMNPTEQKVSSFSIQWDSFPEHFPYFISTEPESSPLKKQIITMSKKEEVLFVMGPDLLINKYSVHGIPYYSITSKRDTMNNLSSELMPFFKSYFPDIRDFWQDDHAPYYYICTLPLFSTNQSMAGGFGCGPGFMMKYTGKFDDWNKKIIAHETAHNWIGQTMVLGKNSFEHQWFGEGFNDYVMLLNLIKSDMIDQTGFLHYLNTDMFLKHYTSPAREAKNDSIAPNYWRNDDYEKLPYRRGFIFAFYLDNKIRMASEGHQSIRDVLLALLEKNREIRSADPCANLSLNDFITITAYYLPHEQLQQEIENYLIQGNLIDFRNVKLIREFKVNYRNDVPVLEISDNINLKKSFSW
ncbi:M1 family aminopeptidase [Pedobacter sp. L105]|uniref:M1 family aminopeptidase n=1 Tax=Pedobacter sp. L105 TaxID=1641871 RepID=UPI00131B5BA9|nr:M1 family aminopeptidase [Pedobacter sp. L105]